MPGNSPDKLQSGQERWKSFLDVLQVAFSNVFELSVQGSQKLNKIFGSGVQLLESLVLGFIVVKLIALRVHRI